MLYDQMVKSENSDPVRDLWRPYREMMTQYVCGRIEDSYRRTYLAGQSKRKADDFSLEQVLAETGEKPVVAVWGAGRCNDLDIHTLAGISRLVLIDRETAWTEAAREQYGLNREQCVCADMGFWDISEEEERYFERLLAGGADDGHLAAYLRQLSVCEQAESSAVSCGRFDYSVCLGLASQLNARFAGLMHIYKKDFADYPETESVLREMNACASGRLLRMIAETTGKAVILANELYAGTAERAAALSAAAQEWTAQGEETVLCGGHLPAADACRIAGSREFLQEVECYVADGRFSVVHRSGAVWPFVPERYFFMDVMTASVNKINQNGKNR